MMMLGRFKDGHMQPTCVVCLDTTRNCSSYLVRADPKGLPNLLLTTL